jgi:hypothetical protein
VIVNQTFVIWTITLITKVTVAKVLANMMEIQANIYTAIKFNVPKIMTVFLISVIKH